MVPSLLLPGKELYIFELTSKGVYKSVSKIDNLFTAHIVYYSLLYAIALSFLFDCHFYVKNQ